MANSGEAMNNIKYSNSGLSVSLVYSANFKKRIKQLEPYGSIQKFIDAYCLKGISPYMPFKTGTAEKSGIIHTSIGSGLIVQKTPYIRYIYRGKVMIGKPPKTVTNINLRYDKSRHPKAGKEWWVRFVSDNRKQLESKVNKII